MNVINFLKYVFIVKKYFRLMGKLKKYRVKPSTSDVFAVSLVDEPAVDSNFIALSKQKPMDFKIQDEEKRMLYGVALRADYPIYRRYGEDEFYLVFDKEAIERLVNKFMSNYGQKSFTLDHIENADGIVITESWIVSDVKNDKASALGLENFSKGSWIIGAKINNDEIWRSVKDGRWGGFSIESWIDMEEIEEFEKITKDNSIEDMTEEKNKVEEMFDKIKDIISQAFGEEKPEKQEEVKADAEPEEQTPAEEPQEPQSEEEKPAEEPKAEDTPADEDEKPAEEEEKPADEAPVEEQNLSSEIESLRNEIETLKAENKELKKTNEKLSKMPSAKPIVKTEASIQKQNGIAAAFDALKSQGFSFE